MKAMEFFKITLPVAAAGLILILGFSILGKRELIKVEFSRKEKISSKKRLYAFILLFFLCLTAVFRLVDYKITFAAVLVSLIIIDRRLIKKVDYSLLATFVFFLIFTGNIGNIDSVKSYLFMIIKGRELIFSVFLSQILSNVPTTVLLSNFTDNYKSLIVGTNIGGLGTLVASLASLISYKLYMQTENASSFKYVAVFTLINIGMLIALFIFSLIFII